MSKPAVAPNLYTNLNQLEKALSRIDNQVAFGGITLGPGAVGPGMIGSGVFDPSMFGTGWINGVMISDGTITADKIFAHTITADQIYANTITANEIFAHTITADEIFAHTITADQIMAHTITADQIFAKTITAQEIFANTITANEIAAHTITANKIVAHTITADEIFAHTITATEIVAGSITAVEIAAGTIVAGNIAGGTITGGKIAAATITATNIAAGTITAGNILAGTITAAQIAAGTITATQIAADTITAGQIAADAITVSELAAGSVTAAKIGAHVITANEIFAGTITSTEIAAGTITGINIASATITSANIAGGTITGSNIAGATITASNISVANLSALSANLGTITSGTVTGATLQTGTTGARMVIDTAGFRGFATDGTTKVIEFKTSDGSLAITGAFSAGSTIPASAVTGQLITSQISDLAITAQKLGVTMGGANFLTDSSFAKTGLPDWTTGANTTLALNSSVFRPGTSTSSASLTAIASGDTSVANSGNTQRVPVLASVAYSVSAYFRANTTTRSCRVEIGWYNSSNALISTSVGTAVADSNSAWTRVSVTATSPSTAVSAAVISRVISSVAGEIHYVDDAQIEAGDVVTAYAPRPDEILPGFVQGTMIGSGQVGTGNIALTAINSSLLADGAVLTTKLADANVTLAKMAASSVDSAQLVANAVTNVKLATDAVASANIQTGAVLTAKLADANVTLAKMAANSVDSSQLVASAVTNAKMAINSVDVNQIVASAVTNVKLGPDAVDSSKIANATITGTDIAATTIAAGNIVAGTITATQIAATTITGSNIAATTIVAGNIVAGTITTTQIASATILAGNIAADTITASQIAANAITSSELNALAVTAGKIAANAITSNEIAANTIVAADIASHVITANEILAATITATEIAADTITANQIAANAITSTELAAGSVTTVKLVANAVTANEIAAGAITATKLSIVIGGSNFLDNSGAESTTLGGAPYGNAASVGSAVTRSTASAHTGAASFLHTVSGASGAHYMDIGSTSASWFAVQPSTAYTLSGYFKLAAGTARNARVEIRFYTAASAQTGSSTQAVAALATSAWQRSVATATSPSDAAWARVLFLYELSATPDAVYWDSLQLEQGDVVTAYAPKDGETPIAPGTITGGAGGMIAGTTITGSNIFTGTITATQIATDTITAGNIAANAVDTSELNANAVTAAKIAANTITASQIAATTITGSLIAASTITGGNIAGTTITAANIASGTITATQIQSGTITTTQIAATTILASNIASGTITATQIATDTITANQIAANAIGTTELVAGSVTTSKLNVILGGNNKMTNSGFDDPVDYLSDWTIAGGTSVRELSTVHSNGAAVRLTASGAFAGCYWEPDGKRVRVQQGKVITVSGWIRAPRADSIIIRLLMWTAISGGTRTSVDAVPDSAVPAGAWARVSATFTIPGGVVGVGMQVLSWNSVAGDVYYFDDFQIEEGDVATSWNPKADEILPTTISGSMIQANTITGSLISTTPGGKITASNIEALTITAAQIAATTITGGKIAAGTITATNIAGNTITAALIAANTITASEIATGTITSTQIAANTIAAVDIAAGAIGTDQLAAGAITAGKLDVFGTQSENMVMDPSFEGLLTESPWAKYPGSSGTTWTWYFDDNNGTHGNRCLRIDNAGPTESAQIVSNLIPVTAGDTYAVAYSTRAGSVTTVGRRVIINEYNTKPASNIATRTGNTALTGSLPFAAAFTRYEHTYTVPAGVKYVTVMLMATTPNIVTSVLYDEIDFRKQIATVHIEDGAIDAMTVTGATIRSSSVNPRVEMTSAGLKFYETGGAVSVDLSSVAQGLSLTASTTSTPARTRSIDWLTAGGALSGQIYSTTAPRGNNWNEVGLQAFGNSSRPAQSLLYAVYDADGSSPPLASGNKYGWIASYADSAKSVNSMWSAITSALSPRAVVQTQADVSGNKTSAYCQVFDASAVEGDIGVYGHGVVTSQWGTVPGPSVIAQSGSLQNILQDANGRQFIIADIIMGGNSASQLTINYGSRTGGAYTIYCGINTSNGNGANVTNTGVWQNGTSLAVMKENFEDMPDILAKIGRIPVQTWNFKPTAFEEGNFESKKDHDEHIKAVRKERRIGPYSEDFYREFPEVNGDDNKSLAPSDLAGLALGGVSALIKQMRKMQDEIDYLRSTVEAV